MRTSFPGTTLHVRAQVSAWALCLALPLSAGLSGCGPRESGEHFSAPASASQVGATTPTLRTSVAVGRLVGRLPVERRRSVRRQVGVVVDRWWEAAYLSGGEASAAPDSAFPGFTDGARSRAREDRDLMTLTDVGSGSVTPLMRKVHLDLLSVGGHARSVTARFDLRLRVNGIPADTKNTAGASTRSRRLQIRGRLFLTHGAAGWKVFGYDVSKGWL